MSSLLKAGKSWCAEIIAGWNRFWFTPSDPHTLALLRILAGAMLLYTHLVWSKDLIAFLGPHSWIPREASMELHQGTYAWSHLWYFDSPAILWAQHVVVLVVMTMFLVGLFSRVTSVLAFLLTISYCHRLEGALFGLDQGNAMLAMYLMIGPCGAVYSVDRWIAKRKAGDDLPRPVATTGCNIAIRLIQVHMCIIYLFSGIGKLHGYQWVTGEASWLSFALIEYQSLDMTWLADSPYLLNFMTHLTVFWELTYCALVWPRLTRPWVLLMAVFVHGGIIFFLGMPTFGLVMLIGNLAFISPKTIRKVFDPIARRISLAIVGKASRAGGSD